MDAEEINNQLRTLLRESTVSRYAIAKETGLSQPMLCRFLNEEDRGLSLRAAASLADYFGFELKLAACKSHRKGRK